MSRGSAAAARMRPRESARPSLAFATIVAEDSLRLGFSLIFLQARVVNDPGRRRGAETFVKLSMSAHSVLALAGILLAAIACPASAQLPDPLRFFEGRTESVGLVKLMTKKPFKSRAIGKGQIRPDGSLDLVQRVEDHGEQPRERRWRIRPIGPGRYSGTMSEAKGPVTVEEIGDRYRFRFRMEGSVFIEQWLTPLPDGRSARSVVTIRKYGIKVGSSDAVIRKLN